MKDDDAIKRAMKSFEKEEEMKRYCNHKYKTRKQREREGKK